MGPARIQLSWRQLPCGNGHCRVSSGIQLAKYTLGATQKFDYKLVEGFVKKEEERIKNLISGKNGKENVWEIRAAAQNAMMDHVHIFRTASSPGRCCKTAGAVQALAEDRITFFRPGANLNWPRHSGCPA